VLDTDCPGRGDVKRLDLYAAAGDVERLEGAISLNRAIASSWMLGALIVFYLFSSVKVSTFYEKGSTKSKRSEIKTNR